MTYYTSEEMYTLSSLRDLIEEVKEKRKTVSNAEDCRDAAMIYFSIFSMVPGPTGAVASIAGLSLAIEAVYNNDGKKAMGLLIRDLEDLEDFIQELDFHAFKFKYKMKSYYISGTKYLVPGELKLTAARKKGSSGWMIF